MVGPYLSCEIAIHLQGPFLVLDRYGFCAAPVLLMLLLAFPVLNVLLDNRTAVLLMHWLLHLHIFGPLP